jgi:hypothetical protein
VKNRISFGGLLTIFILFSQRVLADIPPPKPKGAPDDPVAYGLLLGGILVAVGVFWIIGWIIIKRSKRVSK